MLQRRGTRAVLPTALLALAALSACGGGGAGAEDEALGGGGGVAGDVGDVGRVTVQSGDEEVTAEPICVGDIPEEYNECPMWPSNIEQLQLAPSLVATVSVPSEIAEAGYRVRINGEPLPGVEQPIQDATQAVQVPQSIVDETLEPVLIVESLRDFRTPQAVWQFTLQDPVDETAP